ncbi:integrase [Vibrio parahaemolyticus O1:Kuk str. FDA_R31]|uniref:gamma-mobile-trio integrase GmtZ n=1 Tax=Vibrio harveyi group TaxID=717610 RepID=UPI0003591FF8|nr:MULTISPECIES: integrase family protein [Vibrio harveyi group]AGQ93956.1 integrase [Vibrio parahaemolyticus O1:Kuk str. FDA_R31]EJB0396221.1 integrase family protein [Vibrio parahaemolyticus]EJB5286313.1 integrase family protein [Vibrio parahaemolyticus]EJG2013295.1 integrase family protein [Vibrio parahaemolyticus]EJG2027034.1 integrase family protein [Vibrio parahaemolyticus]
MAQQRKRDGRTSDLTFSWMLTTLGAEWNQWQELAAEWMAGQNAGVNDKLDALARFFESYLAEYAPYAISNIDLFFKGYQRHKCSSEELEALVRKTQNSPAHIQKGVNHPCDFIDFVIEKVFSEEDDNGNLVPLVGNPLSKIKRQDNTTETVRNPLPYRYIQDLRQILCPLPDKTELAVIEQNLKNGETLLPTYHYRHFKHWTWAQQQIGGDWFDVEPELIDKSDPDCVWRTKEVTRKGNKVTLHQIWSPVKAMVIFMKLHLPLRTYQVRMLDSGEADTWRYEQGQWVVNTQHDFALGSEKRPFRKGVFRRIHDTMTGLYSTGLFINTNKTADQNKDELERGYIIPWQNEEVLYWLEKLRNWQEKYNPIAKPTDCTTLLRKHVGAKKSDKQLESMGETAFLFRDASAKGEDKSKPIAGKGNLAPFWYQLLLTLENQLADQGNTLDNGERLKLVVDYPEGTPEWNKFATLFPLHSLRVSLITAYTMDTQLPLPVISKLLAGHTRLLMTIYYNKITPSVMANKMDEAHGELDAKSKQSVRNFLKDASMEQIQCKMVYHSDDSIQAALVNRNPIGWEERSCGLCLVGGNTVKSDEVSTLGGCWNGGELIKDAKAAGNRVYASVPHGPENCPRCRWFITEARYLPALNAHFNQLSYKAHQAANLSVEIEGELETLKDEQFFCEEQGKPFIKHDELQALQRRYEKQQVEADEYAKDWIACFELIQKIIRVEETRNEDDAKDKLIAVGSEQDVSHALKLIETDSELLHLSLLCDDAEFYPDLQDELRKTPAIQKRSMQLSRVLMKKGFEPIFMEMDDKQQLIAANAMLRQMAKIADPDDKLEGYRKVANYIEAGEYLTDNKLLSGGIHALSNKVINLDCIALPNLLED